MITVLQRRERYRRAFWSWAVVIGLVIVLAFLVAGCQVPLRNY